jgi:hypothetical protein
MGEPAAPHDFDDESSSVVPASLRDARLRRTLREIQRLQANLAADLLRDIDTGTFRDDGHLSAKTWIAAVFNCDDAEATEWVRLARAQRQLPETAEAFRTGRIGLSQLRAIAKVFRNPRCRQRITDGEQVLARFAARFRHREFTKICGRFVSVVDPDGTLRDHDAALERRDANERTVGTEFVAYAKGDTKPARTAAGCGRHNRAKHALGLTIRRDERGTWHIHRPDGTEIAPLHPDDPPDG